MTTDKLELGGSAFPLAVYDPVHGCINYKDGMTTRASTHHSACWPNQMNFAI